MLSLSKSGFLKKMPWNVVHRIFPNVLGHPLYRGHESPLHCGLDLLENRGREFFWKGISNVMMLLPWYMLNISWVSANQISHVRCIKRCNALCNLINYIGPSVKVRVGVLCCDAVFQGSLPRTNKTRSIKTWR